jgi:predicted DNA-binding transcriptional regulator YafY
MSDSKDNGRGLAGGISPPRAARLYRLLSELHKAPKSRVRLLRRLRSGIRTFYRDLDLLRSWGIEIRLEGEKYTLGSTLSECLARLPFPDPELTFAEAIALAKGATVHHRKLRRLVGRVTR